MLRVPGHWKPAVMPDLLIDDIPDYLLELLRVRASVNSRSLEDEIRTILIDALPPIGRAKAADPKPYPSRAIRRSR
jgi:plasmid stability protein